MPINILMPALSPTMEKGNLAKWLKKEGDAVKAGDVIAEIETDKATMEVEAVDEGKLAQILVDEGTEGVAVNTPIAVLSANGEDVTEAPVAAKPAPKKPEAPAPRAANIRRRAYRARRRRCRICRSLPAPKAAPRAVCRSRPRDFPADGRIWIPAETRY